MSENRIMTVRMESTRGYSAYEIAVQHGYTGTEEQWIAATQGLPEHYLKTAAVNAGGDTLTLTRQDGSPVEFKNDSAEWSKVSGKPASYTPASHTHTANECGALPSSTVIPSKTSDLTNDSGFITATNYPAYGIYSTTSTVSVPGEETGMVEIVPAISEEVSGSWTLVGPIAAVVDGNKVVVTNWHHVSGGRYCVHYKNNDASTQSAIIRLYTMWVKAVSV